MYFVYGLCNGNARTAVDSISNRQQCPECPASAVCSRVSKKNLNFNKDSKTLTSVVL